MRAIGKFAVATACGLLALGVASAPAGAQSAGSVTHITVNGQFASAIFFDPSGTGTNGGMTASRDQLTNTSALDFSWGTPDPTTPDQIILIFGSGPIPNAAFTISVGPKKSTAHVAVTVSNSADFQILRCVFNNVTGDFSCVAPSAPITFDVTWVTDGFSTLTEHTEFLETLGPITTRFQGSFTEQSGEVNGSWGGHTSVNNSGDLLDTHSQSASRDITVAASR
jgi:hypothetical protein